MKPKSELHRIVSCMKRACNDRDSRLAVDRPTLIIKPLLRKVWPKHRPLVLLTSPSA